jgi:large conductance mechanosensitive channel
MRGFIQFIKEQGIAGLALGFILGGSISKLVTSFVEDIIQPIIGFVLRASKGLEQFVIQIGDNSLKIGNFLSILMNFIVIAIVVYGIFKIFKLDKIEKKIKL